MPSQKPKTDQSNTTYDKRGYAQNIYQRGSEGARWRADKPKDAI